MESKNLFKRLAVAAFAGAMVLGVSRMARADNGAGDGQKVSLKVNLSDGQKWQFSNTTKTNVNTNISANGQQQQLQQTSEQHRGGTMEILAVKDGEPSSIRATFDHDCGVKASQNGQEQDQPSPMADKTITVTRGADGQITNDANADQATAGELEELITPDRSIYPANPVGVGDSWDGDVNALVKQFQVGQGESVSMKCTLLQIGQLDNVKTADTKVVINMVKMQNGIPTKTMLVGVAQIDLASGQVLAADLMGPITFKGTTQFNGVPVDVDGSGQIELHTRNKLVGGSQTAAPAINPVGPAIPAPGPAIPLAGGDDSGKFTGTFNNDKIAVDLTTDGSGKFGGTVTVGANKFPASASVNDGKLVGTFTAGGDSFDFTATVEGSTMTFASGKNTYTLTKKANPLDNANPAPRNPLDDGAAPRPPKPNPLDPQTNNTPAPAPAAGGAVSGASASDSKTMVMTKFTVPDPMIGCDAGSFLIPENWKCQAKMVWKENAYFPVSMVINLYDPQSAKGLMLLPQGTYCDGIREMAAQTAAIAGPQAMQAAASAWPEGAGYMGAEVRKQMDPAQYLQNVVIPQYRKDLANAQASQPLSVPEIAKVKAKAYSSYQGLDVQTVKVRYSYEVDGKPVDEDIYVTVYTMPMPGSQLVFWNTDTECYRAERGQLDQSMALYRSVLSTIRPSLQWFNGVMQVSKMMQDNMRQSIDNAGKLSKYITQVNNDISDMIKSSYEEKCKSDDITSREISQTTRGVDLYGDGENRYEVPIGYDHYYKNDKGQILMTSDPHFDPNQGGWTEMQRNPER